MHAFSYTCVLAGMALVLQEGHPTHATELQTPAYYLQAWDSLAHVLPSASSCFRLYFDAPQNLHCPPSLPATSNYYVGLASVDATFSANAPFTPCHPLSTAAFLPEFAGATDGCVKAPSYGAWITKIESPG